MELGQHDLGVYDMRHIYLMLRGVASIAKKRWNRFFHQASVNWLGRKDPFSRVFGLDRGFAIDRVFIERFILQNAECILGRVLEIGDDQYTYKYGSRLEGTVIFAGQSASNRSKCFAGDLTIFETFAGLGQFDCLIATNVLNFIFDFDRAVKGLASLVKPKSGVVLVTVAGLSQISRFDYERWGDFWRFNDMSIRRVFERYFNDVDVVAYGNAPLAAAFIMGLSREDVPASLFEHQDSDFQILVAVKASSPKHNLSIE
jgi:hypothetical protein